MVMVLQSQGNNLGGGWEEDTERIHKRVRSGYHLLMHFQYDLCHFRNIQGSKPNPNKEEDERFMVMIR